MNHRLACLITATILLLTGTAGTTLAQPLSSSAPPGEARALLVVREYFTVLNAGMRTGNFSPLASVYARNATLTEHRLRALSAPPAPLLTTSQTVQGLSGILAVYRIKYWTGERDSWTIESMSVILPTMVVCYAHTARREVRSSERSWQRFVIQSGRIMSLEWAIYSLPQRWWLQADV